MLCRGNGGLPYGAAHPKGIALRREGSRRYGDSAGGVSNPNDDDDNDLGATDSGDPQGQHNLRCGLALASFAA